MGTGGKEDFVGIAHANDRVEAEMIRGLLESAGIPSAIQQIGVDGPALGFGLLNPGGGSRQVMVPVPRAEAARAVLAETLVEGGQNDWDEFSDVDYPGETRWRKPRSYGLIGAYARILLVSLIAMGLAFAVFLLLRLA
jgi:Putative prokaryotic signal transducing protein